MTSEPSDARDRSSSSRFFAQSKAEPALIDLHIHLLPGIDDGCDGLEDTLALARASVADGVSAVAATPHVNEPYPTTPQTMQTALAQARAALAEHGIPLEVRSGAEIALDRVDGLTDDDLRAFSLGGSGSYILLECPFSAWPMGLELQTGRLAQLGMRSVLAHPERSAGLQRGDDGIANLRAAVDRGLLVQINAGSLANAGGKGSAVTARRLLAEGLVHIVASDAHEVGQRPPRMREAAAAVGDAQYAQWLTQDVPAAVLAGTSPPDAPERSARARGGLLRRLRAR